MPSCFEDGFNPDDRPFRDSRNVYFTFWRYVLCTHTVEFSGVVIYYFYHFDTLSTMEGVMLGKQLPSDAGYYQT